MRDYAWLGGRPLAQIEYGAGAPGRAYYVHTDHLGTPRKLTSPEGATAWSATVQPYGEVAETATPDPVTGRTVVTNLRLPGQYDERVFAQAGLGLQGPYYNWNRWYLPSSGRYLEPDPVALVGERNIAYGVEWYAYASGSPLDNIDPDGLTCRTNWDFFWDWVRGRGDSVRYYGPDSKESAEMKAAHGSRALFQYFLAHGCREVTNWCYGTTAAYLETFNDPCSTAFQVGGFCGDAMVIGRDEVGIRIRNRAGTRSFFYHSVPDRTSATGAGRTIDQGFEFIFHFNPCDCAK